MKNLTKLVMLGLLLVPFAAIINLHNAFAETVNVTISPGSGIAGCEVENKCFVPYEVTVPVGGTVVWKNGDSQGHTITSGNSTDAEFGQVFDSSFPLLKPEATFEHTFDAAGTFPYFCQVHPYMMGKVIVGGAPPPRDENELYLTTDNGSVKVEVAIDNAMIMDNAVHVDPPQAVKFDIEFLDPTTDKPIEHLNYQFHVADASGAMVAHEMKNHSMGGTDSKSVAFSNTGSYSLMIVVEGTGTSEPYDTKYSGTATTSIMVTPEFPLSVMAIMAAVVGIGIAATRFRNPIKL